MSKTPDIDKLEQRIRELKSIIRSLQKKLKKTARGYNKYKVDEYKEEEEDFSSKCPECTKGTIKETNILGRVFFSCSVCEYKSRG